MDLATLDVDVALLPTDADVAFYREHGYYMTKKIYTDEEIEAAVRGSERYYPGGYRGAAVWRAGAPVARSTAL